MELTSSNQKYQEYLSPSLFSEDPKFFIEKKYPLGFRLFNESQENKIFLTSNKSIKILEEYKSDNLGKITNKKLIQIDEINKLSTFEEVIQYGINIIKLKDDYILNRICELKELSDSEADFSIALDSLKGMFLFIGKIGRFSKPSSLTISENGLFYLKWQRNKNNSITVRFQHNYFSDYVIFKPSSHTDKRIILNGSMNVMDLIDYLNNLNIKTYQEI